MFRLQARILTPAGRAGTTVIITGAWRTAMYTKISNLLHFVRGTGISARESIDPGIFEYSLCRFVLSIQIIALLNSDSEGEESPPFRSDASASPSAAGWQAADAPGASPFQVSHCLLVKGKKNGSFLKEALFKEK